MSWTRFVVMGLVLTGLVWTAADTLADKPPLDKRVGGLLVGDQTLDAIYLTRDLNGDGDADDPNEASLYYQDPNDATNNLSTILQSAFGYVLYGDVEVSGVYRLRDLNYDCDAMDPNEFNPWFTNDNACGFQLTNPNGVWEDSDGVVYILNAGTTSTPVDAIYRTVDLNDDGDAQDVGEATLWMDVQTLVTDSAAFELVFLGDVAYWADSLGGGPDAVMRAEDLDGDGAIEEGEFNVFIDEASGFGVGIFSALATDGVSLYVIDLSGSPQTLFQLTDLNDSGTIDDDAEVVEVWDESQVPAGFDMSATFSMAMGPGKECAITSNGGDTSNLDNIFRLIDLNQDGDYMDEGETIVWAQGNGAGTFVERARAVEYILAAPGDVNGDSIVDLQDLAALLSSYGLCEGDEGYNVAADFDNDDCITLADLATLLSRYGQSCP
jgi:hypothetical protein